MTLAQRLGFYVIDVDKVAGFLTEDLLLDYSAHELSYMTTIQYLRTRYMRLVGRYGMPVAAVDAVAEAGWKLVRAAGAVSPKKESFAFYE